MLLVGAASVTCEPKGAPRSLGGFGESIPLQTSTSVSLSVHYFRDDERTCFLAAWAYVVPPSVVLTAVLLGHDSWLRFKSVPIALCPLGRRTIVCLASSSYLTTPRQACGLKPQAPLLRVKASTFVPMVP